MEYYLRAAQHQPPLYHILYLGFGLRLLCIQSHVPFLWPGTAPWLQKAAISSCPVNQWNVFLQSHLPTFTLAIKVSERDILCLCEAPKRLPRWNTGCNADGKAWTSFQHSTKPHAGWYHDHTSTVVSTACFHPMALYFIWAVLSDMSLVCFLLLFTV